MRDSDEHQQITQASILDRLIDDEPDVSHEPVQYRLASIRQIKASVIRDLENLLNTRRSTEDPGPGYQELGRSLYVYGIRDFTSQNPGSAAVQQELKADLARAIEQFEPRLHNVVVHVEAEKGKFQSMHFRISGLLIVEPDTEPVTFDTYFDINRGEYIISK